MVTVTESIGHLPDSLDHGISTFTHGIGDSISEIVQNLRQVLAQHPGFLNHRLQTRVRGPEIPCHEVASRPTDSLIFPQFPRTLFNRPCSRCLQMHPLQTLKSALMSLRDVLLRVHPEVFRPLQPLIALFLQLAMFLFAHIIYRLHHVCHQMIAVKHNLLLGLRNILPNRGQIRIPNVHGDGFNLLPCLLRKGGKIIIKTLFLPVISHIFHRPSLQVVDHCNIVMPPASRLLVHPDLVSPVASCSSVLVGPLAP